MKKLVAIVLLGALLVSLVPQPSHAGGAVTAALALGAFAVFTQLFVAPAYARPIYVTPAPVVYQTPVYYQAPVYYTQPPAYYAPSRTYAAPAPPAIQREVVYPHGRYILHGDGVTVAYQWVWLPNPPAPPPPPPAAAPPSG